MCHAIDKEHLPEWNEAKVLNKNINKGKRKALEVAYIVTSSNINRRSGDLVCGEVAVCLVIN